MSLRRRNCIIAQSGGPTAVINASLCGIAQEVMRHAEFEGVYGARHAIVGILEEDLVDLRQEDPGEIGLLNTTPGAALGACRHKLPELNSEEGRRDLSRVLEVLDAHDVHYLFYIGGNDSMDTASKVLAYAQNQGYDLRVVGVPKTVDNDLPGIDHCPGYGSVAKHIAAVAMGVGLDMQSVRLTDPVAVMEVQGRYSGWMTASTALARRQEGDAPNLVYLPEVPWDRSRFLEDVRLCHSRHGWCFIAVSTAIKDEEGDYVSAPTGRFAKDAFGHLQLAGVGLVLSDLIKSELGLKTRVVRLGPAERVAMYFGSLTDRDEAFKLGTLAVRAALDGETGKMASIQRVSNAPYRCEYSLADLSLVAGAEKRVPREWINGGGSDVTPEFIEYARPLIRGEVPVPIENGLPRYARLQAIPIARKLPAWRQEVAV